MFHCLQWVKPKEKKRKHHETPDNHPNLSLWPSYARRGTLPNKCIIKHVESKARTQMWSGFQHSRPTSKDCLGGSATTTQFKSLFRSILCGLWWDFSEAEVLKEVMRNLTVVKWAKWKTTQGLWCFIRLLMPADHSRGPSPSEDQFLLQVFLYTLDPTIFPQSSFFPQQKGALIPSYVSSSQLGGQIIIMCKSTSMPKQAGL